MTPRFSIQSALGLMLLAHAMHPIAVQAQPATVSDDAAVAVEGSTGEAAGPGLLELLEFIGEFTTEDGEWVDPALLLEADDSDLVRDESDTTRDGRSELGADAGTRVENCRSTLCE